MPGDFKGEVVFGCKRKIPFQCLVVFGCKRKILA
jgi:hypothetical protein